jgi:tRNA pseudouridine55 synthase
VNKPRRPPRRRVDGVLLLDKPTGMTSNAALQAVRRLFNAAKAGHTGTLDPLATGLLPLCFGEATKFAGELLHADKSYRATLRLGVTTDTADSDGRVIETRPVAVTVERLNEVLASFLGAIDQIPPMHSALKRDGKPLYEYAREGIELERAARRVNIHRLDLVSLTDDRAVIDVDCSKGALRRTRIGRLDLAAAVSLAQLEELAPEDRDNLLAPADTLVADIPAVALSGQETGRILHGQGIRWQGGAGQRYRLYSDNGAFLGLGELAADGWLNPRRLIASP